jgi:hypothetical protein
MYLTETIQDCSLSLKYDEEDCDGLSRNVGKELPVHAA